MKGVTTTFTAEKQWRGGGRRGGRWREMEGMEDREGRWEGGGRRYGGKEEIRVELGEGGEKRRNEGGR